jgi:SAM-dependent methyltransferase
MTERPTRDGAWGAAARDWAEAQEGTLRPLFEAVLDANNIGPGQAVLDVACGTGLYLTLAAARGATVAGIDASAGQLAVARERLPDADLREGEMDELPFADDQFDLVTICNALQYANDTVTALTAMRRVARPGGTLGILMQARPSEDTAGAGVFFTALAPFRPPSSGNPASRAIMGQEGALETAITTAGLTIVATGEVDTPWVYPDLETALRGALSFAPGVRAQRIYGAEPVRAAIAEAFAPYHAPDGSYTLPSRGRYTLLREA